MANNFAHLRDSSPFYSIFPSGMAPIVNIALPSRAQLEGCDETEVYTLDQRKCTAEQLEQIAEQVAKLFAAPKAAVLAEIEKNGLPIRASQCSAVSSDSLWFLEDDRPEPSEQDKQEKQDAIDAELADWNEEEHDDD